MNDIEEKILKSKKYSSLDKNLISRIIKEESTKYNKLKDIEQNVKKRLHILYGMYFKTKSYNKCKELINNNNNIPELLKLHNSTNERLSINEEFYKYIKEHVKDFSSVIDIGCGFNPFTFFIQDSPNKYFAYDVDKNITDLINYFFKKHNINGYSKTMDIITEYPKEKVDVTYMFKIVPLIENQKTGRIKEIISKLSSKYIVITYPLKSISGKKINMYETYSKSFVQLIPTIFKLIGKKRFDNELIFILEKNC